MAMSVGELRAALVGLPDDMPVIMSSDAEGNHHSPLHDADQAMYEADSTWSGDVYLTPEQLAERVADPATYGDSWDIDDDSHPADAVRVLVLGPVN